MSHTLRQRCAHQLQQSAAAASQCRTHHTTHYAATAAATNSQLSQSSHQHHRHHLHTLRTSQPLTHTTTTPCGTQPRSAFHTTRPRSQTILPQGTPIPEDEKKYRESLSAEKSKTQSEIQSKIDSTQSKSADNSFFSADGKEKPSKRLDQLAEEIINLSMMESKMLADLIRDKMGLPADFGMAVGAPMQAAAAPAASSAAAAAPAAPEKPKEEKKIFNVTLTAFDAKDKIKVIKEVRAATGLGLKESKEMVEATLPKVIKKDVKKEDAEAMMKKLTEAGAKITLD